MATTKASTKDTSNDSTPQTTNSRLDNPGYSDILTAKDSLGTERVVTVATDSWEPAPIDPSEEAVAAAKERNAREEANREERLKRLGYNTDVKASDVGKDVNTGSTGDPTTTNSAVADQSTSGTDAKAAK